MRGLCNRDICYAVSLLGSVRYSEFERLSQRNNISTASPYQITR